MRLIGCCVLSTVFHIVLLQTCIAAELGSARERRNLFKKDTRANRNRHAETKPEWSSRFKKDLHLLTSPSGGVADLRCPAEGSPTPDITWLKDNKPFNSRPLGEIQRRRWMLRLSDLTVADDGNYTCVVSNPHGEIRWTFTLDVIARPPKNPPFITTPPQNQTALEGDDVTFKCDAVSDATITLQWMKHYYINGSLHDKDGSAYVHVLQVGNGELILANVTDEDAGMYTCHVSNDFGFDFKTAFLVVQPKPELSTALMQQAWQHYVLPIAGCLLFLIIVAVLFNVCLWQRRKHRRSHVIVMQANSLYRSVSPSVTFEVPYDSRWEISRDKIQLGEQLGEGAFGRVVKGYARGLVSHPENTVIAVKMLKEDATERELSDLIQEIKIMKVIGSHVNIINLIGCCTQGGPIYVIVEYAAHGNLRDFLRAHRPPDSGYERPLDTLLGGLTCANLVSFAYQVARGMEYLSGRKIVHRDLAARNVLVAENFVLKIADFGLTRYTSEEDYYRLSTDGRFPVKWMAPESLIDRKYSTKSDIWSFGVLLWEVFTLGGNPYPAVRVENLVQLLRDGHRMEPPPYGSVSVYSMMLKCWQWQPRQRPSFPELVRHLDYMVAQAGDSEYLNLELSDLSTGPRTPRPSDSQYSSLSNASIESTATPIPEAAEDEDGEEKLACLSSPVDHQDINRSESVQRCSDLPYQMAVRTSAV